MTNVHDGKMPERPRSKQKARSMFEGDDEENEQPDSLTYFESLMKMKPKTKKPLLYDSTELGPWRPQAESILTHTGEKPKKKKKKLKMPSLLLTRNSDINGYSNLTEPKSEVVDSQADTNYIKSDPQLTTKEVRLQRAQQNNELTGKTNLRAALTDLPKKVSETNKKPPVSHRAVSREAQVDDSAQTSTARNINIRPAPAKFFQQEFLVISSPKTKVSEEMKVEVKIGRSSQNQEKEMRPVANFPYLSELIQVQKPAARRIVNVHKRSRELQRDISLNTQQNVSMEAKNMRPSPVPSVSLDRIKKRVSEIKPKPLQLQELKTQVPKSITPQNIGLSPKESVIGKGIHFIKSHVFKKPLDEEQQGTGEKERASYREGYSSNKSLHFRARSANLYKPEQPEFFIPGVKVMATPRKENLGSQRGEYTKSKIIEPPGSTKKGGPAKIEGKSHRKGLSEVSTDRPPLDDPLSNHFTQTYDVGYTMKILKKINQNARILRPALKASAVQFKKGK